MSIDNVQDITPRKQYIATGGQTIFPYPFPIFDDGDLVVDVDGSVLVITTNYTVSGAGDDNGGNVTLTVGATAGQVVTIYRDIAIERDTDFQQNGPWRSAAINDELDRMTLVDQQLELATTRALRVNVNDEADFDDLVLPGASARASRFLAFDSNGIPVVSAGTGADAGLRDDIASGAAGAVTFVPTVAEMKALTGLVDGAQVQTAGHTVTGKGAGLYRASTTVVAENGGRVINNNAATISYRLIDPVLTLHHFGAIGDDSTNDTAAIALAKNFLVANGENIQVLPGTYQTDPFQIAATSYAAQAMFVGVDRDRCVFKRRTNGAGAFVTIGSASAVIFQAGMCFDEITIDGGVNSNGDAFVGYDIVRTQCSRVRFKGGEVACHLYGGISITLEDCLFDLARVGFRAEKFTSLAGGGWPNLIRINGGEIVDNSIGGVYFDNGRMLVIEGVDVEGNGTTKSVSIGGIYIGPNIGEEVSVTDTVSIGLIAKNCWFEGNTGVADINSDSGILSVDDSNFFSQSTNVDYDIQIAGGNYRLHNLNCSFSKPTNINEGASVLSGNIISAVQAASINYNQTKTALLTGAALNLNSGRVPSVGGTTRPFMQRGTDATSANPTINFPTQFASTPRVWCQIVNNSTGTIDQVEVYSISSTGFTARKKTFNGTTISTANYTIDWFALGELT